MDMIIANQVNEDKAIDKDDNEVIVLTKHGQNHLPLMNKNLLAKQLIDLIAKEYAEK